MLFANRMNLTYITQEKPDYSWYKQAVATTHLGTLPKALFETQRFVLAHTLVDTQPVGFATYDIGVHELELTRLRSLQTGTGQTLVRAVLDIASEYDSNRVIFHANSSAELDFFKSCGFKQRNEPNQFGLIEMEYRL